MASVVNNDVPKAAVFVDSDISEQFSSLNMDPIQKVIEYVKTVDGVLDVHEMDEEISNKVWSIERSIKTRIEDKYKNLGYDAAMERQHRICIFYDDTYIFGLRSILKLMDSEGKILGTNLAPGEEEQYRDKDNVIWVSDDFIVFTDVVGNGEELFVLLPFDIPEIEDAVPGVRSVIGTSPTTSSDAALKEKFDKPIIRGVYTMIVAFDC